MHSRSMDCRWPISLGFLSFHMDHFEGLVNIASVFLFVGLQAGGNLHSPTRHQTHTPEGKVLDHWTAQEVPGEPMSSW